MSKVYVFLADGFEDIEGLTVVDLMRRAGIEAVTVSIKDSREVATSHGVHLLTDAVFKETDFSDADMLVLPGGMRGTLHLGEYRLLTDLLTRFYEKGKRVAAICAAPSVLGKLGILKGRRATCYPGFEEQLTGAEVCKDPVVVDGNVTTSRGMGTAIDFGLCLIAQLLGEEKAQEIADSILYTR